MSVRKRTQTLESNAQKTFRWRDQTSTYLNTHRLPMNNDLRHFLAGWLGTVAMALVPVVIAAFITMPLI